MVEGKSSEDSVKKAQGREKWKKGTKRQIKREENLLQLKLQKEF